MCIASHCCPLHHHDCNHKRSSTVLLSLQIPQQTGSIRLQSLRDDDDDDDADDDDYNNDDEDDDDDDDDDDEVELHASAMISACAFCVVFIFLIQPTQRFYLG